MLSEAITAIPYDIVASFMGRPTLLTKEQVKTAPYVVAMRDSHMIGAEGNEVYARGIGDASVDDYCREEGIPILLRIPFDRRIAEGLSEGHPLVQILPEYVPLFRALLQRIAVEVTR